MRTAVSLLCRIRVLAGIIGTPAAASALPATARRAAARVADTKMQLPVTSAAKGVCAVCCGDDARRCASAPLLPWPCCVRCVTATRRPLADTDAAAVSPTNIDDGRSHHIARFAAGAAAVTASPTAGACVVLAAACRSHRVQCVSVGLRSELGYCASGATATAACFRSSCCHELVCDAPRCCRR